MEASRPKAGSAADKQAEIRRQIAALQAQLEQDETFDSQNAASEQLGALTPRRKRKAEGVLVAGTPSPSTSA